MATLPAQTPPTDDLKIVIIDGDNFTNNIKRRTARDPVVEVRDRDNRRVPGAAVVFLLPQSGPGGTFANGSKILNVVADQNGQATATGLQPSGVGRFQIQVRAISQGRTGVTSIAQRNVKGAALGTTAAITLAVIAAAATGVALGVRAAGGGGNKTTISVGPPSLP